MQGNKVTEEIAEIRKVEPWKTINSPNRFTDIDNPHALLNWVTELQQYGQNRSALKL